MIATIASFGLWNWFILGGILLVSTGLLGTEFMPAADNGQMQVTIQLPPGTTLEVTDAAAQKVEQRLQDGRR